MINSYPRGVRRWDAPMSWCCAMPPRCWNGSSCWSRCFYFVGLLLQPCVWQPRWGLRLFVALVVLSLSLSLSLSTRHSALMNNRPCHRRLVDHNCERMAVLATYKYITCGVTPLPPPVPLSVLSSTAIQPEGKTQAGSRSERWSICQVFARFARGGPRASGRKRSGMAAVAVAIVVAAVGDENALHHYVGALLIVCL